MTTKTLRLDHSPTLLVLGPVLFAALISLACNARSQTSEVPTLMSYQGIVSNGTTLIGEGTPVDRIMQFRLYDQSTGGTAIYAEQQTVTVFEGNFSILIGAGSDIVGEEATGPSSVDLEEQFDGEARFLGVTVDVAGDDDITNDGEISPRQQLVSSAFAFRALEAERVVDAGINSNSIEDGSITQLDLANQSVGSLQIVNQSIATNDLSDGAVTAAKLDAAIGLSLWEGDSTGVYRQTGQVGIGTASPEKLLHLRDGDSAAPAAANAMLLVENADSAFIQVNGGDDSTSGLFFGRSGAGNENHGAIEYRGNERLVLRTNTVDRLTIKSDGTVGIGISNPQSTLHIDSPAGTVPFLVEEDGDARLIVAANDNVGIGTDSPAKLLHLKSGTSAADVAAHTNLLIEDADVAYIQINGGDDSHSGLLFGRTGAGNENHGGIEYRGNEKMVFRTGGADQLTIEGNGNLGLGTTNPVAKFHIKQGSVNDAAIRIEDHDSSADWRIYYNDDDELVFKHSKENTGFWFDDDTNGGAISSDRRLKKDIEGLESALTEIQRIPVMRYRYHATPEDAPKTFGYIAQDVEKVFPSLVKEREGFKTLAVGSFVPINTRAIQELKEEKDAEIAALRKRLAAVEAREKQRATEHAAVMATFNRLLQALPEKAHAASTAAVLDHE